VGRPLVPKTLEPRDDRSLPDEISPPPAGRRTVRLRAGFLAGATFPRARFARSAIFFLEDFFADTFFPRVAFFFVFFATVRSHSPLGIAHWAELYTASDERAQLQETDLAVGECPGIQLAAGSRL